MKAKIAFYKTKGNYIDKAIRIWTNHPNGYGYNAMAIPIAGWIQSIR